MRSGSPLHQKLKRVLQISLMKKVQDMQSPENNENKLFYNLPAGKWVRKDDQKSILSKKKIQDMMGLISFANSHRELDQQKEILSSKSKLTKSSSTFYFGNMKEEESKPRRLKSKFSSMSNFLSKKGSMGSINLSEISPQTNSKFQSKTTFTLTNNIQTQEPLTPLSPKIPVKPEFVRKREISIVPSQISAIDETSPSEILHRDPKGYRRELTKKKLTWKASELKKSNIEEEPRAPHDHIKIKLSKLPELKTDALPEKVVNIIERRQKKMYGEYHLNNLRIREFYNNNKEKFSGGFLTHILKDRGESQAKKINREPQLQNLSPQIQKRPTYIPGNKYFQQRRASILNKYRFEKKNLPQKMKEEAEINSFMDNCFMLQYNQFMEELQDEGSKEQIFEQIKKTLANSIRISERKLSDSDGNKQLLEEFKAISLNKAHDLVVNPKYNDHGGAASPQNRRRSSLLSNLNGSPRNLFMRSNSLQFPKVEFQMVPEQIKENRAQIIAFTQEAQELDQLCVKAKSDNKKFRKKACKDKKVLVESYRNMQKELRKYHDEEKKPKAMTLQDFKLLLF